LFEISLTRAFILSVYLALTLTVAIQAEPAANKPPRLVLQITVDQLRGDMPDRVYDRFVEGGFRYLYENGIVYRNAHHRHANTETIVGHATLATGADPSVHGMIGNVWLDRETGKLVYNIEDDRYQLLTANADVDRETEIDPTQKVASAEGRSPAAMLSSTFSDELALHYDGKSKIFAVSVKDRGAVSMAGHAGKAFWFSKQSGEFVSSTYYYQQYPYWVIEWNEKRLPFSYGEKSWELLNGKSSYQFGEKDDMPYETDFPGYGRTFPHPFGAADGKYFTTLLTLSPVGDELTLDFAKRLMEDERLGEDETPDYLSISFSSTDYVGHLFGPSSLESEDNLLRLDRILADLFRFVDQRIGLNQTLIVMSADHGSAEIPGRLQEFGIDAEYFVPDEVEKEKAIQALKSRFGIEQKLVSGYYHPYIYLNHQVVEGNGLDWAEVEHAVAAELTKFKGVALALPSSDLRNGRVPATRLTQSILRNYNPKRSGDIYVVFKPHWFVNDFDGLTVASTHGSPWRYDTFVPIVFAGHQISHQSVFQRVETVDAAPTLCAYLGIKGPSGATGGPLVEVLSAKQSKDRRW